MKIKGTKKGEILKGTPDGDFIKGKGGNDYLVGGGGFDILKGGKGADTFVISTDGFSVIKDFRPGQGDKIVIDDTDITSGWPSLAFPPEPSSVTYTNPILSYEEQPVAALKHVSFIDDGLVLVG